MTSRAMNGVHTRLAALSICPCGAPVLRDEIALGAEYVVYPQSIQRGFIYRCGGCGKVQHDVPVILASSVLNPTAEPKPLPLALFDLLVAARNN